MEKLLEIYKDQKSKEGYKYYIWLFNRDGNYFILEDDALNVSKHLGLLLELNGCIRYLSFPYSDLDIYLPKLIRKGYKVAIIDL